MVIDLPAIDLKLMGAMRGMNVKDATFHRQAGGDPIDCTIAVDTLEIPDEFGVPTIRSGVRITYLLGQTGTVSVGDWFQDAENRYPVENKIPSRDPSMRVAHASVETLT